MKILQIVSPFRRKKRTSVFSGYYQNMTLPHIKYTVPSLPRQFSYGGNVVIVVTRHALMSFSFILSCYGG